MIGVTTIPQKPDLRRFKRFEFNNLLPRNCSITCDLETFSVTLQCLGEDGSTYITEQQVFSPLEFTLLMHLFEQESLEFIPLADFLSICTGQRLTVCQNDINRAWDEGNVEEVVRPVRNLMSRMRRRLRRFGLDARSVLNAGYKLMLDETRYH